MIYFNGINSGNYFEGWFFRICADGLNIALIPSISASDGENRVFIQINCNDWSKKLEFNYSEFYADDMTVRIGGNVFTSNGIIFACDELAIDVSFEGNLSLQDDIMGCFRYGTPCKHKIISMCHSVNGNVRYMGGNYILADAAGYIEKDWGRSFPKSYCWIQCNHLDLGNGAAFFFSVAKLDLPIWGLICSFIADGREYRFATYNLARIKKLTHGEIALKRGGKTLVINFEEGNSRSMIAPKRGRMVTPIKEDLNGKIRLRLYDNDTLLYDTPGAHAGIEWVNMNK